MVLYIDIWREFFGGVPTSTTILDGKRDITRGKCLEFSVFYERIGGCMKALMEIAAMIKELTIQDWVREIIHNWLYMQSCLINMPIFWIDANLWI
jgi:hypothetical protein